VRRTSAQGSAAPVRGLRMQSFSRDPLPGDGGHPRTTAVSVADLLGGVIEGQVPGLTGRSQRNRPRAGMGRFDTLSMARSGPSGFNPSTAMEATARNSRVRSATPNGLCSPERLPSWSFRTGVRTLPTGPAQRTAWIGVPTPYGLHWPESGLSESGANGNANHWVGAQFLISRSARCTSWGRFQASARSTATPTSASTQNRGDVAGLTPCDRSP